MDKIRILSLDGGGSRAGVHARTLGKLYGTDTPGREIIRRFDFVAGNSGGSIVFTALCCDYTPHQIEQFYNDPATLRRMYSPKWVAAVPFLRCALPRYSSEGKLAALKWIFDRNRQHGEPLPSKIRLNDWKTYLNKDVKLLVVAFDYDRERAAFFRSDPDSPTKSSSPPTIATLVEAVHASTNAPIRYFDKPAEVDGRRYWDGAFGGYNNPVLAAVVEALATHPDAGERMCVLSLGTGARAQPQIDALSREPPKPLGKPRDGAGLITGLIKAATVIFGDPPDAASFHAHAALRQPLPGTKDKTSIAGNVVRLCPVIQPIRNQSDGKWTLPKGLCESDFRKLLDMELDAMDKPALDLIRKMCDLWYIDEIRNQPIRMGAELKCDVGHEKFSEAAAHWHRISS